GGALAITIPRTGGGASVAVGAAAAINHLTNQFTATIANSDVDASGPVSVVAESMGAIDSFSLGIAGSVGVASGVAVAVAGAGSGSANLLENTIVATITGDSEVTSDQTLTVHAEDRAFIVADAGSVGVSVGVAGGSSVTIAVGVSVGVNEIRNNVIATASGDQLTGLAGITVEADASSEIDALTFAGSGSVAIGSGGIAFAGAGAGTRNIVNFNVQALVNDATAVDAGSGQLVVQAKDKSHIKADSGSVAIGVGVGSTFAVAGAAGAAVALNDIGGSSIQFHGQLATSRELETGDAVVYHSGGGTPVGGLVDGRTYYVIKLDNNSIRLAASKDEATGAKRGPVNEHGDDDEIADDLFPNPMTLDPLTATAEGHSFTVSKNGSSLTFDAADVAHGLVKAAIINSDVNRAAGVQVNAESTSTLDSFALGIGGSVSVGTFTGVAVGGAGGYAGNLIGTTIEALIEDSHVTSNGRVDVTATDRSSIVSDGGGAGFGVGVGLTAVTAAFGL
ncbi:MAG: hypothetical protein KDA89_14800, partial [Planctomycetaceae bacterium]|nr:hypothetical protein [Planctomycetaceae bacterium]